MREADKMTKRISAFAIYHGIYPLHKSCINLKSWVIIAGVWICMLESAIAQSLMEPGHPFITHIAPSSQRNCGMALLNPALNTQKRESSTCAFIRASQLYQISGLYQYALGFEFPNQKFSTGAKSLQWGSYQKLEWLASYGVNIQKMGLGFLIHLTQDRFPAPYLNLQMISLSAGTLLPLSEKAWIAAVSEQILSIPIGVESRKMKLEQSGQRSVSISSSWKIAPSMLLVGGVRLEPDYPIQSDVSLEWTLLDSFSLRTGYRSAPTLLYHQFLITIPSVGLGLSSSWHRDLGVSVSVSLMVFTWK
jgi:hypothetical protein